MPTMPPSPVYNRISSVGCCRSLSETRKRNGDAEQQLSITVGGDGGTASFGSRYQYDLFALLPILEQLDESRAKRLLEENQTLQAKLQQYPQGLSSLDPPPPPGAPKDANNNRRGLSTQVRQGLGSGSGAGQGQSAAAAQAYMNQETMRTARDIAQEC